MEREIETMLERAEEALAASQHLHNQEFWEDTASRSYYSIYHCLQALLFDLDIRPKSHQGCHRMFHKHYILTSVFEEKYGSMIIVSFETRQRSDYDYSSDLTKADAEKCLTFAKEFLDRTKLHFSQKNN
ncbi:MAG: HEPN domain-containing protein [Bacteroidota bacterium]